MDYWNWYRERLLNAEFLRKVEQMLKDQPSD